jgi:recombination associated protein RdgC
VWLDPKAGLVLIDAASMKKADAVITRLVELMGGGMKLSAGADGTCRRPPRWPPG